MAGAMLIVVCTSVAFETKVRFYRARFRLRSNLSAYGKGGLRWEERIKAIVKICISRFTKN